MGIITYFSAPSYQNMFPNSAVPQETNPFQKRYAKSVSLLLKNSHGIPLVFIPSQELTMIGHVSEVISVLYSVTAKMMTTWNGSIKDLKNG